VIFPAGGRPLVAPSPAPAPPGGSDAWRGSGTVLLVDDDEGVRAFGVAALLRYGFDVLTAADGGEALELYARRAAEIDVVVLDRTLPGTVGDDVLSGIRRIRPDASVVLMSGYAEEPALEPDGASGAAGFLRKPFTHEALAAEVRRALEGRREAGRQPFLR
jgi:DNA-binding NtrC family response regulator